MTTPYPTSSAAQVLAAQDGPWSQVRIGTIVSFTTNQAVVSVGGANFTAAYLRSATLNVGDLVAVLRQQGSWLVLDAFAGVGANLLGPFNSSFEESPPGVFPAQWFFADVVGTSTAVTQQIAGAPDGTQVASVASADAASATSYLYSSPIGVTSGDQFSVSAFAGGDYQESDSLTADAALVGLWFANATDLYPATSSADIVIVTATDLVQAPPYTTLSGTVTAPVTGFMRIALRSIVQDTQRVLWDQVILRSV